MIDLTDERGFAAVGLQGPKDPTNVGSVLRAAGCFGVEMVALSGQRYQSVRSDTLKIHRHMPVLECENVLDVCPHEAIPVGVDLTPDARPLTLCEIL